MTNLSFESQLENYAELIIKYGLNVQAGQDVRLAIDAYNRDFAVLLVKKAYQAGAKFVAVDLIDRRFERERIIHNSMEELTYVPKYIPLRFSDFVDNSSATASIRGEEDPDIMSDLPENKISCLENSIQSALEYFYDQGISQSRVHWTVAAAATPLWAKRLFPEKSEAEAVQKLWEWILKICRCDRPDFMNAWHDINYRLTEYGANE